MEARKPLDLEGRVKRCGMIEAGSDNREPARSREALGQRKNGIRHLSQHPFDGPRKFFEFLLEGIELRVMPPQHPGRDQADKSHDSLVEDSLLHPPLAFISLIAARVDRK